MIAKTHRQGRVRSKDLLEIVGQSEVVECYAEVGDVLLMSPLLFHASRKSMQPKHRRVIHLEYSAMSLPQPLTWHEVY